MTGFRLKGTTLVELVVSIVIISVTLTATMAVITGTTAASADPMIRAQALAIGASYMEEILA